MEKMHVANYGSIHGVRTAVNSARAVACTQRYGTGTCEALDEFAWRPYGPVKTTPRGQNDTTWLKRHRVVFEVVT